MFDYLIENAQILDGSGKAAYSGDVALCGGRIAAVGHLRGTPAAQTIDAAGRTLTPGFIDIHRHGDGAVLRPGFGAAELAQGLTTVVNGCCGLSLAPISGPNAPALLPYLAPIVGTLPEGAEIHSLAAYRACLSRHGLPLHVGTLVGMGTLRGCVAGFENREMTDEEYRLLHHLLETALADGAAGVSLGLGYAPDCFYSTASLLRALEPLRRSGVVLAVHMRQEGDGVVDSLREMLEVARALETPVQISHLKGIGRRNWKKAVPEMLRLLTQAREEGVDIACDVYPYPAGSTQLIHTLPPEFQNGGIPALTASLREKSARLQMRRRMESGQDFENLTLLAGFENICPTGLTQEQYLPFEGKPLSELADSLGKDPFDALFDLLADEHCATGMIDTIAHEEDIDTILRVPFSFVISDSTYPAAGMPHRRVYGTFPRILETYVKKRGILTLPEAVRKMTRLPADRLGLTHKGRIEVGADADLCLFDPNRIHEADTWAAPRQMAQGMDLVFVGGQIALQNGHLTGLCAGTAL